MAYESAGRGGPSASTVFDSLPEPLVVPDARERIRTSNIAAGRRIGVIDDDPTGSQTVHDVAVVTVLDEAEYAAGLEQPGSCSFVLTNSRSMSEQDAADVNTAVGRSLHALGARLGAPVEVVSRSDSTLRGHLLAEVRALRAVRREATGDGYDATLLVPAYFEAGRVTAGDIHWARVGGELLPVGETEFANDATFGYAASDLRRFVAEKSGGAIEAGDVHSLTLDDIRVGGPERVSEVLASVSGGDFVVVNAVEDADLDVVVLGILDAEAAGRAFLYRTGPSFVRALAGLEPQRPLDSARIWPDGRPAGYQQAPHQQAPHQRAPHQSAPDPLAPRQPAADGPSAHGLVVVGSHVGLTSRQVDVARRRGGLAEVELDVAAVVDPTRRDHHVATVTERVVAALAGSDALLFTSRTLTRGSDASSSLDIARVVSAAVAEVVRGARTTRPAWFVVKGGITSHDVAVAGLGIRRAEVAGQLFPGMVSVWRPWEAAPEAVGVPYVVFAGNVGDETTLASVLDILRGDDDSVVDGDPTTDPTTNPTSDPASDPTSDPTGRQSQRSSPRREVR